MTDEDRADGITRTEFDELRAGLSELADAFRELREASTPQERRRAQGDVDEAEEDLDNTARRLGVSRAKLEESIAAARKAERKEELREPLRELLDELKADDAADDAADDDTDDNEPPAKKKPAAKKPAAKKPPASTDDDVDDPPHVDDPPVREHWSERGIGGMIR